MNQMNNIGLQMYTLREESAKDFIGTLKAVADIGYNGVEFAGYGGLEAFQLKELLKGFNLISIGSHVSYERLLEALDEEIAFNLEIGSRYIICPFMSEANRANSATWQEVFNNLEKIGLRCAEKGIEFCYHNHEFELTQQLEGETALDKLFNSVSEKAIKVELDTCWVYDAGYDPIAYIEKYAGRLPLIHFKDIQRQEGKRGLTVELGQGEVDLLGIYSSALKAGAEWIVVEQDLCQNPPLVSIENSLKWMKNNLV
jgi:sugar phosphate isomerase/epimerase